MARFTVESVLKLRDDLSRPLTRAFERVEQVGDRVARRVGRRFTKAFRDTEGKLSLERTFGAVRRGVGFGLAGAAAGATAFGFALDRVADRMARIDRAAEGLNVSAEFLAGFQSAAARQGIENVDDLARGFEEFNLRLSELRAKKSSGELFGKLEDIGATDFIKQLRTVETGTEALTLALSALASETDEANRTSLADALFGGSDASLDLKRIAQNREALGELLASLPKLAGATNEQFRAARRLSDAKARLSGQIRSVAFRAAGALAPAFERAADAATQWLDANQALVDQRLGDFADWVAARIEALMDVDWGRWFAEVAELAGDAIGVLKVVGTVIGAVARTAISTARMLARWARRLGIDGAALARVGQLLFAAWAVAKFAALGRSIFGIVGRFRELRSGVFGVIGAAGKMGAAMKAAFAATVVGAVITLGAEIWNVVKGLRAADEIVKRRQIKNDFQGMAEAAQERSFAAIKEAEELRKNLAGGAFFLRGFGRDGAADDRTSEQLVADAKARLAELTDQAEAARRQSETAEELARLMSGGDLSAEDERLRRGFLRLREGEDLVQSDAPEVQALRSSGLDLRTLQEIVDREQARRAEQAKTAAFEQSVAERGSGGAAAATTTQLDPSTTEQLRRTQQASEAAARATIESAQRIERAVAQRPLAVGGR